MGNVKDKDLVNALLTVCLVLWLYFGYLYRKYGIVYAMIAHLISDLSMIIVFL